LRTLIDFYSAPLTTIETMMSESGIGTSELSAATEELTKSKLDMSGSLRKQEEEGKSLYDYLMSLHTYTYIIIQRKEEATRLNEKRKIILFSILTYLNISVF